MTYFRKSWFARGNRLGNFGWNSIELFWTWKNWLGGKKSSGPSFSSSVTGIPWVASMVWPYSFRDRLSEKFWWDLSNRGPMSLLMLVPTSSISSNVGMTFLASLFAILFNSARLYVFPSSKSETTSDFLRSLKGIVALKPNCLPLNCTSLLMGSAKLWSEETWWKAKRGYCVIVDNRRLSLVLFVCFP